MCGILGKITFSGRHEAAAQFDFALSQLAHRGPDDRGTLHAEHSERCRVSLGHTRLSILDLSAAGHQPMISGASGSAVVYNGEIYNFKDIRDRLAKRGLGFHSECDTEVVLASYDDSCERFVDEFVGMFAIAIWDRNRQQLVLARDRLGIKPLYYYWDGRQFAFASEVTALAALPSLELQVCQDAVHHLLAYGYIPGELSIFKNVRKLRPAHLMRLDLNNPDPKQERYWNALDFYDTPKSFRDEDDVVEALRAELSQAVKRRLISDVPIGAFLSGGIDSSLVVALMQQHSSKPVKTFTIGFSEADFDEAPAAKRIAQHLGTEHEELYINEASVLDIVRTTADHYDEPFADTSAVPSLALARMTRKHVTVALSGDGGDELFWGYVSYVPDNFKRYRDFKSIPYSVRRTVGGLLELLPSEAFRAWGHQLQFKDLVEYYLRKYELKLAVHYPALHLHRPFENDVMHRMNRAVAERLSNHGIDVLTGAMDLHSYLPEDILAKVDRATMSIGLEGRVPILDHNVVQLAAGIPVHFKTMGGEPKHLLKRLLSKYVPKELWERPKKGFGIPISRWLRTSLKEWAHDELFAGNGPLFDWLVRDELQRVFEDHQSGRRDNKNLIWAALQLAGWHRRLTQIRSATRAIG